ncbi:MAG: hypothetical protein RLZZ528_31 [Pseudomonadota bacterium]
MRDFSKTAFAGAAILLGSAAIFGAGMYAGATRNIAYRAVTGFADLFRSVLAEKDNIGPAARPVYFLQPARQAGAGVTLNDTTDDSLILLAGFFDGSNGMRLIRRDGTVLAKWDLSFAALFPQPDYLETPPKTDWNIDLHGSLIEPDGSVVFNFEYGGLARLSRCGAVEWTLRHPTHHSVEPANGGGYWVPGRQFVPNSPEGGAFPPFTANANYETSEDDLILKVSAAGEIVAQHSVTQMFYESGLEAVLTATGVNYGRGARWPREIVHVNKIAELTPELAPAFPMFEAGDLLISLRQQNLVAVVDPDDWRIKWHMVGPWLRQHDPEFAPDGTIHVFNNNHYRFVLESSGRADPSIERRSTIMAVDPATDAVTTLYGGRPGQEFGTVIRGKQQLMPGGGTLVTEFEAGRAFEVDASGRTVWEYVNRFDEDEVAELTEVRAYPAQAFGVSDWSCP